VHPRGTSRTALALVLDAVSWSHGPAEPGEAARPVSARCAAAVNVLRSAGWQAVVVRCGESVAHAWASVNTVEGAATRAMAVYR
jgi:hypothetical protein